MKKSNLITVSIVVVLSIIFLFVLKHLITDNNNSQVIDTNIVCPDEYLYLNELPNYISENPYALNLIKKECYLVINSFLKDIDSDSNDEIFLQTSKLSCGTAACKTREIYILDGEKTLYHQEGYDLAFRKTNNQNEFEIEEQIKYWNEPSCCSSKKLVIRYRYDKDKPSDFFPINTWVEDTSFDMSNY